MKRFGLLACLTALILGCSQQSRTADPQLAGSDMLTMLQTAEGGSSESGADVSGGSSMSTVSQLASDPNSTIFFADAPGPMGPVAGVLAVFDLGFIGLSGVGYTGISQAQIFFVDDPSTGQDGLIVGTIANDGSSQSTFNYAAFAGTGSVDGGTFTASLTDDGGNSIVLTSTDVNGGQLNGNIQLQIWVSDGSGGMDYVGKFSTLAGYQ